MKKGICKGMLILGLLLSVTACSSVGKNHEGEAKTPSGSSIQKGRTYQNVEEEFENAGFTNIKSVAMEDLILGILDKEGEVDSVTVDGNEEYSADKWVPADTEVIINYHSFPGEDIKNDTTETESQSEAEASETSEKTETDVSKTSEKSKNETSEEDGKSKSEASETGENLTIENCEDFANILKIKSDFDDSYKSFSDRYYGQTIEFDACILNVMNHEDYKTRYDILMSAGDFVDENTANPGPYFKFSDVNTYDLGIKDLWLPSFISEKNNIHVIAKVDIFDENQYIFFLKPECVTKR